MGFDKDDPSPLIRTQRRTTRVNVWMVIGILVFFVVAGIVVWRLSTYPHS